MSGILPSPQVRIVSHAGAHNQSCFLHITIEDDEGTKGYGEAALTALWSGEIAQTADVIVKEIIRLTLLQKTFDHPTEVSQLLEKAIYGNSFLKGAIDCAIWDLFGRSQGLSVAAMIKNRALPISLPSRASIGMYPVGETVAAARYFWEAGIRTLKFKTGLPGSLDKDRLQAVRSELGYEAIFYRRLQRKILGLRRSIGIHPGVERIWDRVCGTTCPSRVHFLACGSPSGIAHSHHR